MNAARLVVCLFAFSLWLAILLVLLRLLELGDQFDLQHFLTSGFDAFFWQFLFWNSPFLLMMLSGLLATFVLIREFQSGRASLPASVKIILWLAVAISLLAFLYLCLPTFAALAANVASTRYGNVATNRTIPD